MGDGFVGSSYSQIIPESGELFLGYNDDYFPDNSGTFSVQVTIVPEPSTLALAGAGGALCWIARRRKL
jgi:hypothetical protein